MLSQKKKKKNFFVAISKIRILDDNIWKWKSMLTRYPS